MSAIGWAMREGSRRSGMRPQDVQPPPNVAPPRRQHYPAVRRHPPAIKRGGDFFAPNGWKPNSGIVSSVMAAWQARSCEKDEFQQPNPTRFQNGLSHGRQPEKSPVMPHKKGRLDEKAAPIDVARSLPKGSDRAFKGPRVPEPDLSCRTRFRERESKPVARTGPERRVDATAHFVPLAAGCARKDLPVMSTRQNRPTTAAFEKSGLLT